MHKTALTAWVVRVWETHPPQGQDPLEWILLTTLPITFPCDGWEVVQWYGWRWFLEDFHKALKTGSRIEESFLQTVAAFWKLLAVLTPIALRRFADPTHRTASRGNPSNGSGLEGKSFRY